MAPFRYYLLCVLLICLAHSSLGQSEGSEGDCTVQCTCFGDIYRSEPIQPLTLNKDSQEAYNEVRFFVETESKVLCSGRLRRTEVYVYYLNLQPQDRNACTWDVEVGLFRNDTKSDAITLVSGSSTGLLQGEGTGFSGREYSSFDFNSSGPSIKTGDLFAIQVRIVSGDCLAFPFPLSPSTRSGSSVPTIFTYDTNRTRLSQFSPIMAEDLRENTESFNFDASIQLTDIKIASCSGECGSVAEILPRATDSTGEPTKAIRGSSIIFNAIETPLNGNASSPDVGTIDLPVYALPLIVVGTALLCVAFCVLIVLPLYLKVKRDHQSTSRSFDGRPTSRLSRSSRLARSRTSSTNAVSIAGLGSESYRQPVDAMTMTYHTDEHQSITRSNIYSDVTSVHVIAENTLDSVFTDEVPFSEQVAGHSYAVLETKPQGVPHRTPSLPPHSRDRFHTDTNEEAKLLQYSAPAGREDELMLQLQALSVKEIRPEELKIVDGTLGKGQFGVVRRGVWRVGGEEREVAVKSLADGSTEEKRIQFLQEAAIMGQFKHPSIITLHGVLTASGLPQIVVEILVKGDLKRHLISLQPLDGQVMSPHYSGLLLSFCRQVAAGMAYLSSRGFLHRDLAARNILISDDDMCKIADFGLAHHLHNKTSYCMSTTGKIPVRWTAPEAILYREYTSACDVWSFGILVWEIWSLGSKPYMFLTDAEQVLSKVSAGYRLTPPPGCPRSIYKLMMDCWNPNPDSRPEFACVLQSLQHPDFRLLKWTAEDVSAYSEQARTLGAPLEAGEELYQELHSSYS